MDDIKTTTNSATFAPQTSLRACYSNSTEGEEPAESYKTITLPFEQGKFFDSEKNLLHFSRKEYNKPFSVTVVHKRHPKTIMCERKTLVRDSKYGKRYYQITRFQAHDPYDECVAGDEVLVRKSRPYSKRKHHIVAEVTKPETIKAYLDAHPEMIVTPSQRAAIKARKRLVTHGVVYMSNIQRGQFERETFRLDAELKKANETAGPAQEARRKRVEQLKQRREQDRQEELKKQASKPSMTKNEIRRRKAKPYELDRLKPVRAKQKNK
eukprot:CAMPEP_0201549368 /NCGR_PEP_ID=MMETSP0173_2-20130828/5855_1 /ASSEMBLY_ACC=CAM_ASM_000268 /TAXON_ID=218659 /ORGANISM="Vexillifera sp., Strain DIVA3 564/2" /LENGTH=266 /DNA_ID=CAMNT_0047959023 /DNA_START=53 /DNA_END=854 /DNA_ORIENTATION=+